MRDSNVFAEEKSLLKIERHFFYHRNSSNKLSRTLLDPAQVQVLNGKAAIVIVKLVEMSILDEQNCWGI